MKRILETLEGRKEEDLLFRGRQSRTRDKKLKGKRRARKKLNEFKSS